MDIVLVVVEVEVMVVVAFKCILSVEVLALLWLIYRKTVLNLVWARNKQKNGNQNNKPFKESVLISSRLFRSSRSYQI